MNNSYITIIKEKRTDWSRNCVPLNQNECTADFRIGVPFGQNLQSQAIMMLNNDLCDTRKSNRFLYLKNAYWEKLVLAEFQILDSLRLNLI